MCNLYSVTTNREALRRIVGAMSDSLGNMPELPGIYPDYFAPIVRTKGDEREIVLARWGLPSLLDARPKSPTEARPTSAIRGSMTGRATSGSNIAASCR